MTAAAAPARGRRLRRLAGPAAAVAAAAAVVGYVGAVDPNQPGHYPTCPFLFLTGLYCPGCGALRTLHALAHLDVAGALSLNVLVVAALPLLAAMWGAWVIRAWTGRPMRWLAPASWLWAGVGLVLTFWVLRNLPAFSFLAP